MKTLILNNKGYSVSDQFAAATIAALGTLAFDTAVVERHRISLLDMSNEHELSATELQQLGFLTHIKNVANAIRVVGAHHDPIAEWGFDGWDAVHGNSRHRPCGCEEHHVFDHHSASNHFGHNRVADTIVLHPIEPRRVCSAHAHLRNDPHALMKALEGDKH